MDGDEVTGTADGGATPCAAHFKMRRNQFPRGKWVGHRFSPVVVDTRRLRSKPLPRVRLTVVAPSGIMVCKVKSMTHLNENESSNAFAAWCSGVLTGFGYSLQDVLQIVHPTTPEEARQSPNV
jgi:hypothetical protein